jgi:hypothetical protein
VTPFVVELSDPAGRSVSLTAAALAICSARPPGPTALARPQAMADATSNGSPSANL